MLNSGTGDGTFLFIIVMFDNSQNQIFQYNGSPITFQKGDSVMVNATEMAKPFGKLAKDWLSNKSTKEFLSTLSSVRTIPLTALVEIKQGGNKEQGTWMHEDVALEFARWLSPAFATPKRKTDHRRTGKTSDRPVSVRRKDQRDNVKNRGKVRADDLQDHQQCWNR